MWTVVKWTITILALISLPFIAVFVVIYGLKALAEIAGWTTLIVLLAIFLILLFTVIYLIMAIQGKNLNTSKLNAPDLSKVPVKKILIGTAVILALGLIWWNWGEIKNTGSAMMNQVSSLCKKGSTEKWVYGWRRNYDPNSPYDPNVTSMEMPAQIIEDSPDFLIFETYFNAGWQQGIAVFRWERKKYPTGIWQQNVKGYSGEFFLEKTGPDTYEGWEFGYKTPDKKNHSYLRRVQ